MGDDRLAEIRARLEAVEGPWFQQTNSVYGDSGYISSTPEPLWRGGKHVAYVQRGVKRQPDVTLFIAHAPEDVTYLLSEVERLRALLERDAEDAFQVADDFEVYKQACIAAGVDWTTEAHVAITTLAGRLRAAALPVDPHYPDSVMVWADGNHFDAMVIYREWQAYQRAAMRDASEPPEEWEVFTAGDGERAIRMKESAPVVVSPATPEPDPAHYMLTVGTKSLTAPVDPPTPETMQDRPGPRAIIDRVLEPSLGEMGYALADDVLDALASHGFTVVAAPADADPEPMTTLTAEGQRMRLESCGHCEGFAEHFRLVPLPKEGQ